MISYVTIFPVIVAAAGGAAGLASRTSFRDRLIFGSLLVGVGWRFIGFLEDGQLSKWSVPGYLVMIALTIYFGIKLVIDSQKPAQPEKK